MAHTEAPGYPKDLAVKVESLHSQHAQLMYEARLLSVLKGNRGFSAIYYSGAQKAHGGERYNVLVMDLLGYSLEDLVVMCNGKFSLKTTIKLAD